MKRTLLVFMLICLSAVICSPAFSLNGAALNTSALKSSALNGSATLNVMNSMTKAKGLADTDFEPYQDSEFPRWALDLRRGECIFFGGIPLTYALTAAGFALAGQTQELKRNLVIAASASAVIAIVDYILGVVREN